MAQKVRSVEQKLGPVRLVTKITVSLLLGLIAFLLAQVLDAEGGQGSLVLGIGGSIFVSGVAFVAQFLIDVGNLLDALKSAQVQAQTDLAAYSAEARMLAGQRDADAEQLRLLIRYVEEQIPRIIGETFDLKQKEEPLVRELAHSLNTPLAQMEATILSADPNGAGQERMIAGLEICKAFLSAFRQVATLARDTQGWEPESIGGALRSAVQVYAANVSNPINFSFSVPDGLPGYGKNYVVALLLPLLENAVEASPKGGAVAVTTRYGPEVYAIDVSNETNHGTVLPKDIYLPMWSSKVDHEGLGLATVRNLLAAQSGADISHSLTDDGVVTFTVSLPRKQTK
jgi:signal transduction histidine kinase